MRRILGIGLFAFLASVALEISDATAVTLCQTNETIIFSCPTGTHLVSICAPKRSETSLQYRFGNATALDLAYPATDSDAARAFTSGTMIYSGGGGAWLQFSKNNLTYFIFTAIGKWGPKSSPATAAGVAVQQDGKEVANYPCSAEPISRIGPDLFKELHLKESSKEDTFDIPEAFLPAQ